MFLLSKGREVIVSVVLVAASLIITACGDSGGSGGGSSDGQIAAYTARQVMDNYLKAYQAEDYNTCKKLISPATGDIVASPDAFNLKASATKKEYGPVENYVIDNEVDSGAEVVYSLSVNYKEKGKISFPNMFKVSRTNGAWKLTELIYF